MELSSVSACPGVLVSWALLAWGPHRTLQNSVILLTERQHG